MKIILSRKGLDSGCGSVSNLIVDNEKFLMFPIPYELDDLTYGELKVYSDVYPKLYKNEKYKVELSPERHCHADPDIQNFLNQPDFLASIGQSGNAQTQLNSVGVGDIFLFWGLFSKATEKEDEFEFSDFFKNRHAIFGYLEVGDIIKPNNIDDENRRAYEAKYPWIKTHPHWKKEKYDENSNNAIYVAKENGYGLFKYSDELVLSAPYSSAKSNWTVKELANCKFTNYKDLQFNKNGEITMPSRGQEFILDDSRAVKWAQNLIKKYSKKEK